jgi:hypothetical protein
MWTQRAPDAQSTLTVPEDHATLTYAVRNGQLYKRGSLLKGDSAEANIAGDNVFIDALIWRTLRRFPEAPDADLIISFGDVETSSADKVLAPVFAFSPLKNGHDKNASSIFDHWKKPEAIGFPNPYIVDQALTLSEKMSAKADPKAKGQPWAKRHDQAFWRGSLTAGNKIKDAAAVSHQDRVRLANLALAKSGEIDVAFTDVDLKDTWSRDVKEEMQAVYKKTAHTGVLDFFDRLPNYKFLVNVNGVSASWRGLQLLAAGGVMLLQDSDRGEFFVDDLEPWVHYVPIKQDLSDLSERLSYLRDHDDLAKRIGQAGQDFAYQNLTLPALECYTLHALEFMAGVMRPVDLSELQSSGFVPVPEPDEHLQVPSSGLN